MIVKNTTLIIMLKNNNNNPVTNYSEELNVFIENVRDDKAIQEKPINEVGSKRYDTSFTISAFGHYMISISLLMDTTFQAVRTSKQLCDMYVLHEMNDLCRNIVLGLCS